MEKHHADQQAEGVRATCGQKLLLWFTQEQA
jgi:hypothetical protein